jgi:Fe-S-cluster containining protein
MRTLPAKSKAVEKLFLRLEKEMDEFRGQSGLYCPSGCGVCCKKPDIEATPLEFLPMALHVFDQGKAEEVLNELTQKQDSLCLVFRPSPTSFGGLCNAYPHRGLICRLFGYSARRNKEGRNELVTCRIVKEEQKTNFENTVQQIQDGLPVPVMTEYYSRLTSIDPNLISFYPINEAMKKALEYVLHYYSYRNRRKRKNPQS